MVTPVRFCSQLRITFEDFDGRFAFQYPHQLRYRNLGWNTNNQVNMISLDIQFNHLA